MKRLPRVRKKLRVDKSVSQTAQRARRLLPDLPLPGVFCRHLEDLGDRGSWKVTRRFRRKTVATKT